MDATIEIKFRFLESDYVRAMRSHYASRLRLKLDIPVVILLAALGAWFWWSGSRGMGIGCIAVSVVFGLMLVAAFTVIPRIVFRGEPKDRDEYTLRFSPEGIHFQTVNIDSQLQWSLYSRALVDATSYVLYSSKRSVTVVPKRVFENVEQQARFDRLIAQFIPDITVRK